MNELPTIEEREGIPVIVMSGGFRPATRQEVALHAEVRRLRKLAWKAVGEPSEPGDWECVKASNLDALRSMLDGDRTGHNGLNQKQAAEKAWLDQQWVDNAGP